MVACDVRTFAQRCIRGYWLHSCAETHSVQWSVRDSSKQIGLARSQWRSWANSLATWRTSDIFLGKHSFQISLSTETSRPGLLWITDLWHFLAVQQWFLQAIFICLASLARCCNKVVHSLEYYNIFFLPCIYFWIVVMCIEYKLNITSRN